MSEYTQEGFEEDAKLLRSWCDEGGCAAEFDRMIAEVERRAAEKALTDAAELFATQEGLEVLMFARDDVAAVRVTETWLLEQARTYQRNEGEK